MPKTTIYVAHHKPCVIIKNDIFQPIHVGRELASQTIEGIELSDNTGDNISYKNPNYCELTAIYWMWKNDNQSQFLGLNHYRRYFDKCNHEVQRLINRLLLGKDTNSIEYTIPQIQEQIQNCNYTTYLKKHDFIAARPVHFKTSVKTQYINAHSIEDFNLMRETLLETNPSYQNTFDKFMDNNNLSPYNMFVTNRELLDQYCQWLFGIMTTVEQKVALANDTYQTRLFGFMAERLLNVFLKHNNLKVKYLPVLFAK